MAYFVKNANGTQSLHPSPNVKINMKLEDPEETYKLFVKSIEPENFFVEMKQNIKKIFKLN